MAKGTLVGIVLFVGLVAAAAYFLIGPGNFASLFLRATPTPIASPTTRIPAIDGDGEFSPEPGATNLPGSPQTAGTSDDSGGFSLSPSPSATPATGQQASPTPSGTFGRLTPTPSPRSLPETGV